MQISMILAMDKNGLIGKDNGLPWHHKEDMKWFKEQTCGKAILMGRKTFESIGKPLPYRQNIVLTSTPIKDPNVAVVSNLENAINICATRYYEELVIIGGKQVYESFIDHVNTIYLTIIDKEYEGDTYLSKPNPTVPILESVIRGGVPNPDHIKTLGFDRAFINVHDANSGACSHEEIWDYIPINEIDDNGVKLKFLKLVRLK